MTRPSFQFYPADWQANSNLRRCTHEEKGLWMDILCLFHDQDDYGICRWTLKEIAIAINSTPKKLQKLIEKGILKGAEKNLDVEFIYIPRSGRKDGEPVVLIPAQKGPIWFSSRMVRDEYVRGNAGKSTRFKGKDAENLDILPSDNDSPSSSPSRGQGEGKGDGSSSSSSSSSSKTHSPAKAGQCPVQQVIDLYNQTANNLPQCRVASDAMKKNISSRWKQSVDFQTLDFWQELFGYCESHEFLSGRGEPGNGQKPFRVSLDWIVNATNFAKIVNLNYDRT